MVDGALVTHIQCQLQVHKKQHLYVNCKYSIIEAWWCAVLGLRALLWYWSAPEGFPVQLLQQFRHAMRKPGQRGSLAASFACFCLLLLLKQPCCAGTGMIT